MDSDPTGIRVDLEANRVHVTWGDGHESAYDGAYLREMCPCAGCRGHAPGQVVPPTWAECAQVRITGAGAVGAYAVRFDFTDGHATGIYSFDWLRRQCPSQRDDRDETGRPREVGTKG